MKNGVKIVENMIYITYEGKLRIRFINDILFCESLCHKSEIYFDTVKPLVAPIAISKLEWLLPKESFCKIHRQYIVYLGILPEATIEDDKILFDKFILPISQPNIEELLYKINRFHFPGKTEYKQ